jgi:hypothetical protein
MNEPLRPSDIPALQAKINREEKERWRDMLIASRPDLKIYRTTKKGSEKQCTEN